MFRHREDRAVVALVALLSALDVLAYLYFDSVWLLAGYWLVLIAPKGFISAWNHHHQHCMTFRSPVLNRALEFLYGLHTGMTSNLWVLHHNLGHHVNYLDQEKDESRWRYADGRQMGVVMYTFSVALTAYGRAWEVGKRYPKHQRVYLVFGVLTWAAAAALVAYRPLAGFFVFLLPMIFTLHFTAWATYDHHAGQRTDDHFVASTNIMNRWFNRLTGNLGYHTAHHYKQGVHWSKLPELHEQIKDKIPAELFVKSPFDALLPGDAHPVEFLPTAADSKLEGMLTEEAA